MKNNEDDKHFFDELKNSLDQQLQACATFFYDLKNIDNALFKKVVRKIVKNAGDEKKILENPQEFFSFDEKSFENFKNENLRKNIDRSELKLIFDKALNFFSHQDYEKAFSFFNFLSVVNPTSASVILMKGLCEQNFHKYTDAIISYSQVLEFDPSCLLAYVQLMECLLRENYTTQAKEVYTSFIKDVDPSMYSNDKLIINKLNEIKNELELAGI